MCTINFKMQVYVYSFCGYLNSVHIMLLIPQVLQYVNLCVSHKLVKKLIHLIYNLSLIIFYLFSKNILRVEGKDISSTINKSSCYSKGHRFNSQHAHDNIQLIVAPVPGCLVVSFRLCGNQAYTHCTAIFACKTPIYIK